MLSGALHRNYKSYQKISFRLMKLHSSPSKTPMKMLTFVLDFSTPSMTGGSWSILGPPSQSFLPPRRTR